MPILPLLSLLVAVPHFETFTPAGFNVPVAGVWYEAGEATSAFPLGALGTGFIELNSDGTFGNTTCENDWLKPKPVPANCGFEIGVGDKIYGFGPNAKNKIANRFWGHFPASDIECGELDGVKCSLRAFAPLIPYAYNISSSPAALFRFTVTNQGKKGVPVTIALNWTGAGSPQPTEGDANVCLINATSGTYAIGAMGEGWDLTPLMGKADVTRLEARASLMSGETREITFGVAWYFPKWTSSDNEVLTHYYADGPTNAAEVLLPNLLEAADNEKMICEWQEHVYKSTAPDTLKDAVINGLYILARNSWWMDDGRFFQSESFTGCPITETFVCRFYGSIPLALFWPELEKATMSQVAAAQAPSGELPFGFGIPMGSKSPYYHCQHPIVSTEFVLLCWRNQLLWRDTCYLKEMFPTVKKALQYAMTLDKDGDGLVDEDPGSETGFPANQYYDIWPWWGTSSYTASLWLAALEAGEKMATEAEDAAFASELKGWFEKGSKSFEQKLWTGEYYRLYNDITGGRISNTLLTNALCGQWFTSSNGLPDLVPKDQLTKHIQSVHNLNVAATPFGAVNGVGPDGKVDESFKDHSSVTTIGEVWCFCAMAAAAGMKEEAISLFDRSYENIALLQKTPWNIPWCLDRETGAIRWGIHYYSNPCVWSLFQVLTGEDVAAWPPRPPFPEE